jgi:hypothetical protein
VDPRFPENLCNPYHAHEFSGRILTGSVFIAFRPLRIIARRDLLIVLERTNLQYLIKIK